MHRIGPTAGTAGLAWWYIVFVPILFNGADYPGIPLLQSWEVQELIDQLGVGDVTNMYEIAQLTTQASHIIQSRGD